MDPATLAATALGSFVLPYVKMGADKLAEHISQNAGNGAAEFATDLAHKVWDKVSSLFESDVEKGTLQQFQKQPELIQPVVQSMLTDKLQADPTLAKEVQALVQSSTPGVSNAGALIQGAYIAGVVQAQGAHISGGNVAGVQLGSWPPGGPGAPKAPPQPSSST